MSRSAAPTCWRCSASFCFHLLFLQSLQRELLSSGHLRPNPKPQHPAAGGCGQIIFNFIAAARRILFVFIDFRGLHWGESGEMDASTLAGFDHRHWTTATHSRIQRNTGLKINTYTACALTVMCVCALPLRLKPLKNNFFSASNNMSRPRSSQSSVLCDRGKIYTKIETVAVQLIPIPLSNWASNDLDEPRRFIGFGTAANEKAWLI